MKLNLGCGKDWKKYGGYEGVDNVDFGQKYIFDLMDDRWPFADNQVEEIRAHNVLEHIPPPKIINVMNECNRILVKGGILDILVPPFGHPNSFIDPTHQSMWDIHKLEGDKVNIYVFWHGESPRTFWHDRAFVGYWAGNRPRNADYGIRKWAIENDGKGNYTIKRDGKRIHVRLVKP